MFGWLKRSAKREPFQVLTLDDPVLGRLEFEESNWSTKLDFDGRLIDISLDGTSEGPNAQGRETALRAIAHLQKHKTDAVHFLLKDLGEKDLASGPYNFTVTGIWAGNKWQNEKSSFTLTLELEGDIRGLWRVEIGPSGPLWTGRDD